MQVNSELRDAQLESVDGEKTHSTSTPAKLWFDKTANKIKMMFNADTKVIATEEYVDDKLLADIQASEDGLETGGLLTVEQSTTPSSPEAGKRKLYAKSDGIYQLTNSGVESKVGAGSFESIVVNTTVVGTFATIPSGHKWSFVGSGASLTSPGNYSNLNIEGHLFGVPHLNDKLVPFALEGTNTGSLSWGSGSAFGTLIGVVHHWEA